MPSEVEDSQEPENDIDPPNRRPLATNDRQGAYVFLSTGQLLGLRALFEDLSAIDMAFGTSDTESPVWRIALQGQVDLALEAITTVITNQEEQ
jgi:hypothetical protein